MTSPESLYHSGQSSGYQVAFLHEGTVTVKMGPPSILERMSRIDVRAHLTVTVNTFLSGSPTTKECHRHSNRRFVLSCGDPEQDSII